MVHLHPQIHFCPVHCFSPKGEKLGVGAWSPPVSTAGVLKLLVYVAWESACESVPHLIVNENNCSLIRTIWVPPMLFNPCV